MSKYRWAISFFLVLAALVTSFGCGDDASKTTSSRDTSTSATTPAETVATTLDEPAKPAGIQLDSAMQSVTGTPGAGEIEALVALQSELPYNVVVPTFLSGGYQLDTTLIGFSPPSETDPLGYYSFRYYDPANQNRVMTFNQSHANSRPLSGYYLTEVNINGQPFQVFWHKSLEYLPQGDPVRIGSVGDAEAYVITWQGQYTDAAGNVQTVYYGLTTGSWTGHGWGTMESVLAGLKPLAGVGG